MTNKKNKKLSLITSSVITILIVMMLIISGPAQAVSIILSGLQSSYTQGDSVNFQVNITINDPDQFVPVTNISLNITGPSKLKSVFKLDGTLLSGDPSISITHVKTPGQAEFGYGYGFDTNMGQGFNFGYGYGYGARGGKLNYSYNVSINTTSLAVGDYTAIASINTGNAGKPSFTSATATFTITSAGSPPAIISFAPSTPVKNDIAPATRTFNVTVNQIVNITWYVNGAVNKTDLFVTASNDTITASSGAHNVTAVASNNNGTAIQRWDWNVGQYLQIGSIILDENESGIVSLYLNSSDRIGSFDVNVTYDASVAQVTAISKGVDVEHLVSNINNSTGIARIGGFNLNSSINGNVKLADLTLHAISGRGNSTILGIQINSLADENTTPASAFVLNGTLTIADIKPPVINSVNLNKTTVNASETIHVTVNASDNVGVTSVTIEGGEINVSLANTTFWEGDITAKSTPGTYTVTVTASDAVGNKVSNTSKSYTVQPPVPVGAPSIIGSAPASPVTNIAGETQTFNITVNQTANVTWYINGTTVQDNLSVTLASYTNTSAAVGTWNVSAVASNANGITIKTWIWTVFPATSQNVLTDANGTVTVEVNLTAPDGNVLIVIPANTTVTDANGTAITNFTLQAASVNLTGAMATAPTGKKFLGVNVDLRPDGARFNPPIRVRFNYTDAMAAGLDESNLEIRFYNVSAGDWDTSGIEIIERNPSQNYIVAKVSHFSTFALIGVAAAAGNGGGNGGGGGGGGGVVTSEPYENIEKYETRSKDIIANTPVTYTFTTPEHGIYEIVLTGKESENDIALRVEALKGTSKLVTASAPGVVNKNVNVWAGTKKIKEALIRFKVENSWISGNNHASSDIKMVKWDGSKWVQLETAEKTKDGAYTYYEAKTDTFSVFAITGLKGVAVPTPTPVVTVTETPAVTPTKTPVVTATPVKPPGISAWVYAIIAIVIIAVAVYFFVIRKKEEKK